MIEKNEKRRGGEELKGVKKETERRAASHDANEGCIAIEMKRKPRSCEIECH